MDQSINTTNLKSWIDYNPSHPFPIQNIPFGVFKSQSIDSETPQPCSRIGDFIINLNSLENQGFFDGIFQDKVFNQPNLNKFISQGRPIWIAVRNRIQEIFSNIQYKSDNRVGSSILQISKNDIKMDLPVSTKDYTDFYSSKNHAFNMGKIIRGEKDALQPNWVHLPVGYHGRASTIVVDGTPIRRPRGQIKPPTSPSPIFSESKRLDFEVEVGVIVGKSNEMGHPIKIQNAEDYIFGLVLLNDWSARDIQTWEYVPLGPFNAKNFATTISPWIITLEALEPFKISLPPQDPQPLNYLYDPNLYSWNIPINVSIRPQSHQSHSLIGQTNYKYMYWTVKQQIVHHTVTGCKLNVGDILGSGTISGTDEGSYGCLFEMNSGGTKKVQLENDERMWLEDGDHVQFTASVEGDGFVIGFGDCGGEIVPALTEDNYY